MIDFSIMVKTKIEPRVFYVECSCCQTKLWIDPVTKNILKSEKAQKKKGSLDDLLLKEKKKKDEVDRRFAATAELAKERQLIAKKKFEKAFTNLDSD
ncbi:MAG: hypothetical protein MUP98_06440 [Candidatus Aminicenantes bacterium]|nr:hypothetical protein [Candidatus Aminicenantes bacterium]